MATDVRTITFVQSSDAEFRAWVAEVIAQLLAVGLTQTADTGQIDTVTVTRPGVVNTQAGYAIFRFNDPMQSTKPIFFKLAFGTGSSTLTPSMWLTIGTGSNGSGTITGELRSALQRSITNSATSYANNSAAYDTVTGIFWAHWCSGAPSALQPIIARSCDIDTEAPTEQGVVWNFSNNSAGDIEFVPFATSVTADQHFAHQPASASVPHVDAQGRRYVMRYLGYCPAGDPGFFTVPGMLMASSIDYPMGLLVRAATGAVERTYRALTGASDAVASWSELNNSSERMLMLWE